MGRSRSGLTTKIQADVDSNDLPIQLNLSAGKANTGNPTTQLSRAQDVTIKFIPKLATVFKFLRSLYVYGNGFTAHLNA